MRDMHALISQHCNNDESEEDREGKFSFPNVLNQLLFKGVLILSQCFIYIPHNWEEKTPPLFYEVASLVSLKQKSENVTVGCFQSSFSISSSQS